MRVSRNAPYAGGFTTAPLRPPGAGSHALQIEINRALYMDETGISAATASRADAPEDGR